MFHFYKTQSTYFTQLNSWVVFKSKNTSQKFQERQGLNAFRRSNNQKFNQRSENSKLTATISQATFSEDCTILAIPIKPRRWISMFPDMQMLFKTSGQVFISSIIRLQASSLSVKIAKPADDASAKRSSSSALYKTHSFNLSVPGLNIENMSVRRFQVS